MIKNFKSIEELYREIDSEKEDKSPSTRRYPIRLIFLNSFNSLNKITDYFSEQAVSILQLNKLLPHNDGWLTSDDIINTVKLLGNDTVIVPFSEILRFKNIAEFNTILTSLFEIENSDTDYSKRIYIPLVGMMERFERDFWKTFHRRDNWVPIWYLEESFNKKIKIYQILFEADLSCDFKIINNTLGWLDLWKQNDLDIVICKSGTLRYLYKDFLPDMMFFPEEISTPEDYLEKIIGLKIPIEYKTSDSPFWESLINEIGRKNDNPLSLTFENLIHQHFNVNDFGATSKSDLLMYWFQRRDKYSRWLLKQWFINQDDLKDSYLFNIMSDLKLYSDDEFIEKIWLKIFTVSIPVPKDILSERKSYLNIIHKDYKIPFHQIEGKLRDNLNQLSANSVEIQTSYLTNITFAERKYLIESFKNSTETDRSKYREAIRTIYPELFHYLGWDITLNSEVSDNRIKEYFQEYNFSKVLDQKSDKLANILDEINKNAESFYKWYYEIENYPEFKDSYIVWIDGLGAEWLPLAEYLIDSYGRERNKIVKESYIRKVNLPSITECNYFDNATRISELDEYIHNENPYKYPDDLINQIELIENIVRKEIVETHHDKIIVVSDHGFTFLAQKKFGNHKKYDFSESNHEGRCMWTEENYQNDSEFILHKIDSGKCKEKKALIALKHTSLYNTPYREVHGGATPEEVLVPCFVISKIDDSIIYEIKLLTKELSTKNPIIDILIKPQPSTLPILIFKGSSIKLKHKDEKWRASLKGFKPGNYQFKLNVQEQKFDMKVSIKGGMKEKELF